MGVKFFESRRAVAGILSALLLLGGCGGHGGAATKWAAPQPGPAPAPQVAAVEPNGASVDFVAAKGGFSMSYPSCWRSVGGTDTLDLKEGTAAFRDLSVDVPGLPPHLPGMVTLKRIEKGFWDDLQKRMTSVQIVSTLPQTMPDAQADRLSATARMGNVPMVIDAVIAMRHERVYILDSETDATGAPDGKAAMEKILSSWKWMEH